MEPNRDIIQKADLLLAQLSSGGLLLAQQAEKFIQLAIDNARIMPMMTRVNMRGPSELREKVRFGSRALVKGSEATALTLSDRQRPDLSKVQLDAQLVKAESRISYETLEDNIEREAFENTIRSALAARIALDLETLAFNGDDSGTDILLKTLDGFRVQATSNLVAGGSATLTRSLLKTTLKTMPSEFRQNKRALRYITADEAVIDYHESIGDRMTALGDGHVVSETTGPFQGIPVVDCPVFPTNLGGGTNETDMLFTDPANMLFGVHRDIRWETDKDIVAGVLIIVVSMRITFKFAHEPAVVKTTAIRAV